MVAVPFLVINHLVQVAVAHVADLYLPLANESMDIYPSLPGLFFIQPRIDLVCFGHIGLSGLALTDLTSVQNLLAGHKNLAGVHRLGQIVVDAATDSFVHQPFFLILGDHDHRNVGIDIFYLFKSG